MDLDTYLNLDKGNSINNLSLGENEGQVICNKKFLNLYDFYKNNKQKSNHSLISGEDGIEEFYLLVNELDVNLNSNIEIIE